MVNPEEELHPYLAALYHIDCWTSLISDFLTREEWINEVVNGNTQQGYWEWANHQYLDYLEEHTYPK